MRFKSQFLIIFAAISISLTACGGTPTPNANNTAKNAASNASNVPANVDNPVATTKKAEAPLTNNAPTIGPVVQAYYEALKKKDDAALINIIASDWLKKIRADMKEEKKTGLAAYLAEYDTIPDKPIEVRNEKIDGDKAVAELKGGAYPNWTAFSFINEGGKWKITNGSPEIQAVTSEPNSNKAK